MSRSCQTNSALVISTGRSNRSVIRGGDMLVVVRRERCFFLGILVCLQGRIYAQSSAGSSRKKLWRGQRQSEHILGGLGLYFGSQISYFAIIGDLDFLGAKSCTFACVVSCIALGSTIHGLCLAPVSHFPVSCPFRHLRAAKTYQDFTPGTHPYLFRECPVTFSPPKKGAIETSLAIVE